MKTGEVPHFTDSLKEELEAIPDPLDRTRERAMILSNGQKHLDEASVYPPAFFGFWARGRIQVSGSWDVCFWSFGGWVMVSGKISTDAGRSQRRFGTVPSLHRQSSMLDHSLQPHTGPKPQKP